MTTFEEVLAGEPVPEFSELTEALVTVGDEFAVRQALIRIRAVELEQARLKDTLAQISDRYGLRLDKLAREREELRAGIQTFLERFNDGKSIAFPDAGTAYLTSRPGGVKVADRKQFEAWALETFKPIETADTTTALEQAATLHAELGQLAPGCEFQEPTRTLGVRKP